MTTPKQELDLAVVGAGPGGYVAAIRAAQLGMKVALLEKDKLGGACLNLGCIPSKALLRNAEVLDLVKRGKEFGISYDNLNADYGQAVKRSRRVVSTLTKGIEFLLKKNKIEYIQGTARLVAKDSLEIVDETGKGKGAVKAKRILLATGSRPKMLPGLAVDGKRVITSDEAILQEKLPGSIVIIGAGAVGVEFAYLYSAYGAKVALVEFFPRLLPLEDKEISELLARALTRRGIEVLTNHKVEKVEVGEKGATVKASGQKGFTLNPDRVGTEGEKDIKAEQILVAVGRDAASDMEGLEELKLSKNKGFVVVDAAFQTNVPGIYAIGDLIGPPLLAHAASVEGIVAVEAMAGKEARKLDYRNIPRCTYCQPQVAAVGLSEEEAVNEGHEIKVGRFPFRASGKALASGESEGMVKIIADAKYGEILGVHIIGHGASELISEMALARTMEATPREIMETVHPHPTLSEGIMEAAAAIYGLAIHV